MLKGLVSMWVIVAFPFSCHVIYHELIEQQMDGILYRVAIIVSELFMTHDNIFLIHIYVIQRYSLLPAMGP
jgi:hypothetical protein